MRGAHESVLPSETLELDLESLLRYFRATRDISPKSRQKEAHIAGVHPVISRVIITENKSPVVLDSDVISAFTGQTSEDGKYSFETDDFELKAVGDVVPLICIFSKQKRSVKRRTLLSLNILNDSLRSITASEIRFLTNKIKKCGNHFQVSKHHWCLILDTVSGTISTRITYQVDLKAIFYRYFSSDVSSALLNILKPDLLSHDLPNSSALLDLPMDRHLFYKAIIENTSNLPSSEMKIRHPYLLTELLSFQTRSVQWLLKREGVIYDTSKNSTIPIRLVSDEMYQCLTSYPTCDKKLLSYHIYESCNKLCFGWKRTFHREIPCWLNAYTGNILLEEQLVRFFIDYYRENNETNLPGCGLLLEEMGLGKTVEILSLVLLNSRLSSEVGVDVPLQLSKEEELKLVQSAKTTLIATPQAILQQWYNEICRWCPSLLVTIYKGLGKYPELSNLPRLIAEYLLQYDVVLMNYDTMSKETDYAQYSTRRKQTRGGRKREANDTQESADIASSAQSNALDKSAADSVTFNQNEKASGPNIEAYQAKFEFFETKDKSDMILNQRRFDRVTMDNMMHKLRQENLKDIPHTDYYESPLMLRQWWRVILDEVQMVSYGASRAFVTASLIPRFHSWGVSGTPYRLPAVLLFLKYLPFNYDISKFCWKQLTNEERGNQDFIELWQTLAIRHTKAMVYDDIKLPPQHRILLTIPFTEIEQDKYNQVLDSVLAFVGIYDNGVEKSKIESLSSSNYAHLRSWLVKLRQLCGNSQVGKLSKPALGKPKSKNTFLINGDSELKTLESVLDDMIKTVGDEIKENEKLTNSQIIEICQSLEYVLYPEKVIEILTFVLEDIRQSLQDARSERDLNVSRRSKLRSELMSLGKLSAQDAEVVSEDEYNYGGRLNVKDEDIEAEVKPEIGAEESADDLAKFKKLKEAIVANQARIRSWEVLQHKCYFLLGSAYFQLHDEDYQKKILNLRVLFSSLDEVMKLVKLCRLFHKSRSSQDLKSETVGSSTVDSNLSGNEQLFEKYKQMESFFYERSEECRKDILRHSIKDVCNVLQKKITDRPSLKRSKWINDGNSLLPKSSKSLFVEIPMIETQEIAKLVGNFKIQKVAEQYFSLAGKLNKHAVVVNDLVSKLLDGLKSPLLGADEKSADGDEYERSIQDQDKAACLLLVITHMLMDRSNSVLNSKLSLPEMKLQQDRDYRTEAQRISDKAYLRELNNMRNGVKFEFDLSFEEITHECRMLEIELKTAPDLSQFEVFSAMASTIKNTFENEKSCQNILKKELNNSFNAVFNARVEYFKQLQQISDTVQNKKFAFTQEELDPEKLDYLFQGLCHAVENAKNKHTRSVSRLRYLASLKPKVVSDDSTVGNEDEAICTICQMAITVGSLTSCGHKFCKSCLEEWLIRHPRCPMCKTFTDRNTIYSFTQYKSNLRAEKIVNEVEKNNSKPNHNQIYKLMDSESLKNIQNIKLSNSFGSKVDLIVKLVLHLVNEDPNVQIVIFSQWQDLLVILAFAFDKANIKYVSAKGSAVSGYKKRKTDAVQEFKDQTNIKTCFLLNAQAQSSGLTLINATHIFLCEPLINTSTELQAISRIHRIGQKNVTTVWMFAIENTVEGNVVTLGARKRREFLEANARESSKGQPTVHNGQLLLKENELRAAESLALTLNSIDTKHSGINESTEDDDLRKIYFGFE